VLVAINHFSWQVLRVLARAEAARQPPPVGRELRLVPTRRTKDGTFLDELVEAGLIEVAAKPTPPLDGVDEPAPFRARYRLTALGRHAAEYGEYDKPFTPAVKELTGLAAELAEVARGRAFAAPAAKKPARARGKR
jgi:hypothetical protein